MIKSFKSKPLEKFFNNGTHKGLDQQHTDKLARILDRLNHASDVQKDLRYPGSD